MEASTVYYTDFRCPVGTSLTEKLRRLCIAAGIKSIDMDGKFVAIKMHFGELGNLAFLRPNYAKVVADLCKEQGGQPFLTDCNTLYPGSRKNALEHLSCAQENGFWPMTTGCQIIIGDGLRGTDELEVPVPNGEYCKTAKIGRAIMDADIFISLTHFKGHCLLYTSQPCAYETLWDVADGHLNCMLIQRSGDMGLGVPFNTAQYAALQCMIAQVTGLKPGKFTHVINNAHVYENHVEALREQLARRDQALPAPKIIVNPEVKDFYDFTPEDITLDGYEHLGKLSMTVAV